MVICLVACCRFAGTGSLSECGFDELIFHFLLNKFASLYHHFELFIVHFCSNTFDSHQLAKRKSAFGCECVHV